MFGDAFFSKGFAIVFVLYHLISLTFKKLIIKSNQIKSLLLSHHHSTSALVSEILTSVLQTVQKNNNLHMDSTYLQTVQKTICKIHIHILSTHSVLKTYLVINYTLYTVCAHLHYVHIYTLCSLYIVIM